MDTQMPYGLDYLKNLVSTSLGNNEPKDKTEVAPEGDESSNVYNMPPQSPPAMSAPYGELGPRLQQAIQQGPMKSISNAMGPIAQGAVTGLDTVYPGADAAFKAIGSKASGKRSDFQNAGPPSNINEYLARLAHYESQGNPSAYNKDSTASGMFQYTDPTWGNYQGYKSAKDAPASLQFQRAMQDTLDRLKHSKGDLVQATLTHFLGDKGFQRVMSDPHKLYQPVNPQNGNTTPFDYGAGILGKQVMQDWAAGKHNDFGQQAAASRELYNLPAGG